MTPHEADPPITDAKLLDYLLGGLSDEESTILEESYAYDPALFEQLEAFEDELVRDYVRGQVSKSIKARIESRIEVDPILKRRVAEEAAIIAAAEPLAKHARRKMPAIGWFTWPSNGQAWFARAGWAVATLVVVTALWFVAHPQRQPSIPKTREVARDTDRPEVPATKPRSSRENKLPDVVPTQLATLAPDPGIFRGEKSEKQLQLSANNSNVRFTLRTDAILPATPCRISIRREAGGEVWTANGRGDRKGLSLTTTAPARLFPSGRYFVTLTVSDTSPRQEFQYSFVVRRQP